MNSIESNFVPYQIALDMKSIGFDEPCFTKFEDYFNKDKLYPILATLSLNGPYENEYHGYDQKIINDDTKKWFFTGYKNSVKDHNNDVLSAPTYSQCFRWFRKKGYDIKVQKESVGLYFGFYWTGAAWIIVGNGSYEEAELECLKKLIEIVKEK